MKNIVVPTDFSVASRNAAEYAVSLAAHFDSEISLVNIVPIPVMADDAVMAFLMTTQAEIVENNKQLMEEEVSALSKKYPGKIEGTVVEGYSVDVIEKMAALKQAALIVMGMKGMGKSNSIFGSTTTAVIQKLSLPVFVIPEKAAFRPITHITLAADFDAEIELDRYTTMLTISEQFQSQIKILNVQKKEAFLKAGQVIGKMKTSRAFSKQQHQFHAIDERNVEDGINKFLEMNPADILVMVAHKHNFFERVFGKVHTKEMSYQTQIPLLVLQSK